jgi:hypothetical protein
VGGVLKMGLKMYFVCGWIKIYHDSSMAGSVNMKWTFGFFKRQYSYLLAGLRSASQEGLCFIKLDFSNLCCPLSAEI